MNFSKLIQKPAITYVPETVELPDVAPFPEGTPIYDNVEDDIKDVSAAVQEEIAALDDLIQDIMNAAPTSEVAVPEEYSDTLDAKTITLSDYLQSLGSNDYPQLATMEIFEDHISDVCDTPSMMLSILSGTRDSLLGDFNNLQNDELYGQFSPNGASDGALWTVRQGVADSQKLREEVIHAAKLANKAIDTALWAGLIDSNDTANFQNKVEKLQEQLKRIQSLLKVTTTLCSIDWKSAVNSLRGCIYSSVANKYVDRMFSAYNRAYNKIVAPAEKTLRSISTNNSITELDGVQNLKNILATSINYIRTKSDETLGDLYAIRSKRSSLRLNGAKAVGTMAYTKRLIDQLDIIIAGLETTVSGSYSSQDLEASVRQGELGSILNSKKAYMISATEDGLIQDMGFVCEGAPSFDDIVNTLPDKM